MPTKAQRSLHRGWGNSFLIEAALLMRHKNTVVSQDLTAVPSEKVQEGSSRAAFHQEDGHGPFHLHLPWSVTLSLEEELVEGPEQPPQFLTLQTCDTGPRPEARRLLLDLTTGAWP